MLDLQSLLYQIVVRGEEFWVGLTDTQSDGQEGDRENDAVGFRSDI